MYRSRNFPQVLAVSVPFRTMSVRWETVAGHPLLASLNADIGVVVFVFAIKAEPLVSPSTPCRH